MESTNLESSALLKQGYVLWKEFNDAGLNIDLANLSLEDSVITKELEAAATNQDSFHQLESQQWLPIILNYEDIRLLKTLDHRLVSRMFVLSNFYLSIVDFLLFTRVHSIIKKDEIDLENYARVTRWFDYLQHQDKIAVLMTKANMEKLAIKYTPSLVFDQSKSRVTNNVAATNIKVESKLTKTEPKLMRTKNAASNDKNTSEAINPGMVDFKIGYISKAIKHPDGENLYVSTIDCGEKKPRTVVSGLVKHVPLQDMQNRHVVLIANLKPANMRGIKSEAMVLCASKQEVVELVVPPPDAKAGDRIVVEGFEDVPPLPVLNPKKKIWETIKPNLISLDDRRIGWKDEEFHQLKLLACGTSLKTTTLTNAALS